MNRNFYIALFLVLALCTAMMGCSKPSLTYDDQISLGNKYLSEGNYKEAILAFEAAIKIDPKNVLAYIGIADAFIGSGDLASAEAALQKGIEITNNEELKLKLNDILSLVPSETLIEDSTTEAVNAANLEEDKKALLQTAWNYRSENKPEEAIVYFEKLLVYASTNTEKHEIIHYIGDTYGEIGFNNYVDNAPTTEEWRGKAIPFFKRAKEYFLLSLEYAETNEEKYKSYDRLAWVSNHTDEGEDCIIYGKKAIEYAISDEQKYEEYMLIASGFDDLEYKLTGNDSIEATEYYKLALGVSSGASEKDINWIKSRINR